MATEKITLAQKYFNEGKLVEARAEVESILTSEPRNIDALIVLGCVYYKACQYKKAKEIFCFAEKINSNHSLVRQNLAEIISSDAAANKNLTTKELLREFKKSLEYNPDKYEAWANLATVYYSIGRHNKALWANHFALKANPKSVPSLLFRAKISQALKRAEEAAQLYQKILEIEPNHVDALTNFGLIMQLSGNIKEAEKHLKQALQVNPKDISALNSLGMLYGNFGNTESAISLFDSARMENSTVWQNSLFMRNYISNSPQESFELHKEWGLSAETRLDRLITQVKEKKWSFPTKGNKIRLGFVSGDLHEHSVTYFLEGFLKNYDKSIFEVFLYNSGDILDDKSDQLRSLVEKWENCHAMDTVNLFNLVTSDKIHILFDLSGHTGNNKLDLFVIRAAPIQVSYIGYPNTTGVKNMDYRIVDEATDYTGTGYTTEKLVRMPKCFLCYSPPLDVLENPSCIPSDNSDIYSRKTIRLGSFNNIAKITTETMDMWAKIMNAFTNGRVTLTLKSPYFNTLEARFTYAMRLASRGINISNVNLLPQEKTTLSHLKRYKDIDLALDTYPYSGTTTTCEALFMGVPVVTCIGNTHASRVSASILREIPKMWKNICKTPDEYVSRVCMLISCSCDLIKISGPELRDRFLKSPICDVKTHTKELSDLLQKLTPNEMLKGEEIPKVAMI